MFLKRDQWFPIPANKKGKSFYNDFCALYSLNTLGNIAHQVGKPLDTFEKLLEHWSHHPTKIDVLTPSQQTKNGGVFTMFFVLHILRTQWAVSLIELIKPWIYLRSYLSFGSHHPTKKEVLNYYLEIQASLRILLTSMCDFEPYRQSCVSYVISQPALGTCCLSTILDNLSYCQKKVLGR